MKRDQLQTYFFVLLLLGAGLFSLYIIFPYIIAVLMAAIFAVVFYPIFLRIHRLFHSETLAAALTTLAVCLIVLVPVSILGGLLLNEAVTLTSGTGQAKVENVVALISPLQERLNVFLPSAASFNIEQVVYEGINWLTRNLATIFANAAHVLIMLFVGLMALYYFFKDGDRFAKAWVRISPLTDAHDNKVLDRLRRTIASVVKGSLIIAVIQGALAGLGFAVFNLSNPVLWGSVAAIGALIPAVGTGIVLAPAAVYLFATGHVAASIGLALWGLLVIGLIDNLLRPMLVSRDVQIHPLLVLLSVLGGISTLGASGILFGPIALSLFLVLCDIYADFTHRWEEDAHQISD